MKIGITGHQRLNGPDVWPHVRAELARLIGEAEPPIVGLSSLAIGADQEFVLEVFRCGGTVEAIIPFAGYEEKFEEGTDRDTYLELLEKSSRIEVLEKRGTEEEAYLAAGKHIADLCDWMIAVWDGQPAAGIGGTGDIASYCQAQGKTVELVSVDASAR